MEWTIQDLGALGEFIGALVVVATLIYFSVQLKQAANSIKSSVAELEQASHAFSKAMYESTSTETAEAAGAADNGAATGDASGSSEDDSIDAEFEVKND